MLWQDDYKCRELLIKRNNLISQLEKKADTGTKKKNDNDLKKCEGNIKYWIRLLIKKWIYEQSTDKSIEEIDNTFKSNIDNAKEYIKTLIPNIDDDDINKIIDDISKSIDELKKGKTKRVFYNDRPVIIYKSEIETIKAVGMKYVQPVKGRKQPSEWAQKYLFVFLVWQKAYRNMYGNEFEWALDKEEKLREFAEKSGDTGQRYKRFKKLINNNFISYKLQPALNLHDDFPKLLYKINFLADTGEEAFRINNFRYIWEYYLVYQDSKKYGFCESCGGFITKKHSDKRFCESCQKAL